MTDLGPGQLEETGSPHTPGSGPVRWIKHLCVVLGSVALVAIAVLTVLDIITRNFLGFSFQISSEYGGYLLVATTFLAIPLAYIEGGFHSVRVISSRLAPRGRMALDLVMSIIAVAALAPLEWQLTRLVHQSWATGSAANTTAATPLWIPQFVMPVGLGLLCLLLIADIGMKCHVLFARRKPSAGGVK